jgi:hypothetical protein
VTPTSDALKHAIKLAVVNMQFLRNLRHRYTVSKIFEDIKAGILENLSGWSDCIGG